MILVLKGVPLKNYFFEYQNVIFGSLWCEYLYQKQFKIELLPA